MRDDTVLIAVEQALSGPASCGCGAPMHLAARNEAIWLECDAFERPSRLPARLAGLVRVLRHERVHVVDLPRPDDRRTPEGSATPEDLSAAA
jgi:hypothetical protein